MKNVHDAGQLSVVGSTMGADSYMLNRTAFLLGLLFPMDGPKAMLSPPFEKVSLLLIPNRFNLSENDRITMLSGIAQ